MKLVMAAVYDACPCLRDQALELPLRTRDAAELRWTRVSGVGRRRTGIGSGLRTPCGLSMWRAGRKKGVGEWRLSLGGRRVIGLGPLSVRLSGDLWV